MGLSDTEAYNRIEVARAVRRFAPILGLLADGSLNVTAVRLLAPHLTPENHAEVLHSARWKKKFEIEEIAARLSPRPEVPLTVRRIRRSPTLTAALPSGDDAAVMDPALRVLLTELARKRFGSTPRPRCSSVSRTSPPDARGEDQ